MTVMRRLLSLWHNLMHRSRVDRDLGDELHAAFELLVDEKVRSGMSSDDARRASRLELGNQEFLKDEVRDAVYGGEDFARVVRIAWVEPRFFKTLGVPAALGRTFDDDDRAKGHVPASGAEIGPDTARVVVLSHSAWQGLFAGDPAVLGREIRINGLPRAVIGVLPPDF